MIRLGSPRCSVVSATSWAAAFACVTACASRPGVPAVEPPKLVAMGVRSPLVMAGTLRSPPPFALDAVFLLQARVSGGPNSGPPTSPTLGPGESYRWSIRASHANRLVVAVGDSVDVVLLRHRCGADAGHGQKGCWDASTVRVAPRWEVPAGKVAQARALPTGSWRFGAGTAGARIHALRPGAATVVAILPDGRTVSDSLWVISVPQPDR
jgi:hypothetical protein